MQEILVCPTAKLDISRLLKPSPSPSPPPPPATSSRPSGSRALSVSATEPDSRFGASPTASTAPYLSASTLSSGPSNPPRRPSIGGQGSLPIPPTSSKRTASASPQESRQAGKKTRQWSKADSDELLELRGKGWKWDDIAATFPGRSNTACRLRYQNYLERKYPWTDKEKEDLARLYERYKSQMWNTIASELNIPWKAVEDMHWELGRERMASLAGGRTLHSGRASDDPASDASPTPSGFPPGTPLTPRLTFVATPSSAFSGPLRPPEGRLAGPPAPVTTNGMPMSRPIPGVEGTGFTSLRSDLSDYRPGGSRGPLPSLAEFERGTPAYAAPGVRQYRDEGGEEDESDDGSDDKE
ncbi:MAG: hypothetical protein L6R39_001475 [Caloplaca ligustica]|nr:MAG: hypothetical protein L6R39_001475 [Caloplaca ligustica]